MKNTPLTERHIALGAKMAEFAGYNMPISYTTISDEHHAVRTNAGVLMSATWASSLSKAARRPASCRV